MAEPVADSGIDDHSPPVRLSLPPVDDGRRRLRAIGAARGDAPAVLTDRIQETHAAIAGLSFGAVGPAAAPVRITHDAIARVTYAAVRGGLRGAGRLGGAGGA